MYRVGITHGMRGWFAVLHEDGEPIQTSPFSFADREEARRDAEAWAKSEQLQCDWDTGKEMP